MAIRPFPSKFALALLVTLSTAGLTSATANAATESCESELGSCSVSNDFGNFGSCSCTNGSSDGGEVGGDEESAGGWSDEELPMVCWSWLSSMCTDYSDDSATSGGYDDDGSNGMDSADTATTGSVDDSTSAGDDANDDVQEEGDVDEGDSYDDDDDGDDAEETSVLDGDDEGNEGPDSDDEGEDDAGQEDEDEGGDWGYESGGSSSDSASSGGDDAADGGSWTTTGGGDDGWPHHHFWCSVQPEGGREGALLFLGLGLLGLRRRRSGR